MKMQRITNSRGLSFLVSDPVRYHEGQAMTERILEMELEAAKKNIRRELTLSRVRRKLRRV